VLYRLGNRAPAVHASAFIAPDAALIGDVTVAAEASIWFNVVARGDIERISIGAGSNIQDGTVLHTDPQNPCVVGENVTVGHMAMLHGCRIGAGSLIGIGATLLNGSVIGTNCIVGAHSLVTENKTFPDGVLLMGTPAKIVRELTADELEGVQANAARYVARAKIYASDLSSIPNDD
jgi:carbonic anhydrase/acetyltransferase-like protein (isoleucine patch superfamily)